MNRTKIKVAAVICLAALLAVWLMTIAKKHRQEAYARHFQGTWEGNLSAGNGRGQHHWRFVLKISEANGSYHAVFDEIDFGLKNVLPARLEMGKLAVDLGSDSWSYHGVLHDDGTEIRGIWRWGQAQFLLTLKKTTTPDTVAEPLTPEDYAVRKDSDLQGIWKGTVTNKDLTMRLYLKIAEPTNGNFRAELDSIDYPPVIHFPVTLTNYIKPHLRFTVEGNSGLFLGNLDGSGTVITGRWKQAGFVPLTFVRTTPDDEIRTLETGGNYNHTSDTELQGHWNGVLPDISGLQLHIVLHIAQLPDGSFSAAMDSPDQGLYRIPLGELQSTPSKIRIKSKSGKEVFEGKLADGKLSGIWTYDKISKPVTLERKSS